ncbi:LysR family transcriptional regulator [Ottowia testudinis]|uniref:LysR family transcriptional regulator n=1 Tax=Ottowia testudinis TaxID=2816950 RepID=A0A975CK78_9BURK|nr:LysR family transcriptional regulator [Ottowia testudinis]QTD46507.1 LysR family transcriptional regulator [Ottowia testudinis]
MADLDPYLLRAFMAVAELGTVSAAAQTLHRTQAAVSMQIQRLEALTGSTLFERTPRGLRLTAQGLILWPCARDILCANALALQRMRDQHVQGRVRLAVVEDIAAARLHHLLRHFHDHTPNVQLDLIVAGNRALGAQFDDDRIDLMVCDAGAVRAEPLASWQEELVWAVRSDLWPKMRDEWPVVMFAEGCPWRLDVVKHLSHSKHAWKTVCEASTLVAMSTALQVGIGMGPMMRGTVPPDCREVGVAEGAPAPVVLHVALFARAAASPQARYLADFLLKSLPNQRGVPSAEAPPRARPARRRAAAV